jgi:flagellar biosynthetic protein FliR
MVLDQASVMLWLGHFLWPFLRISGLMLTAPVLGSAMVPGAVKAALAFALAACLALWLPALPPYPGAPAAAMAAGAGQIAYGALLGMCMQLMVAAISCAGEVAGLAMGLSFAELTFRDSPGATPVLYDIMVWAGLLAYMAAGGPIWLFAALAHSFDHGIGLPPLTDWAAFAQSGEVLFAGAVTLALPVLAVSLCINLIVGLTTVFAPSMNLLSIGFPLLILVGLWVLAGETPYIGHCAAALLLAAERDIAVFLRRDV